MDSISIVKKNKNGYESPYICIERSFLEKIKRHIGTNFRRSEISKLINQGDDEYITIEAQYFQEILEAMIFEADLKFDLAFYESIGGQFKEQYTKAYYDYLKIRGEVDKKNITWDSSRTTLANKTMSNAIFDEDVTSLIRLVDSIESLVDVTYKIYKQRDLNIAKENVLESLSYIVDEVDVIKYRQEYDKMLEEVPIDLVKIENYLRNLQSIILEDWQRGITSIENYKPGDKFRFICHSTSSSNFDGDFCSSLVSCSLLTEEFTDTYRSGFGFMFAPANIVGADGSDMYVNNYTDDDEYMLNSSTVPRISSIGKILAQCRKHREENQKNGVNDKVYSEVVIKGFEPIGIFCFTVGEKCLSDNYISAKKLQEKYPHLPIIEIDLTLYKEKDELTFFRNRLIFEIERNINSSAFFKDEHYYDLYEYFWNNYLKLKEQREYKESDIISLYRENSELISMRIDPEKLFSGKYSKEAVRWAIMHNPLYRLNEILTDKLNPYDLKNLGFELIGYIDNKILQDAFEELPQLIKIIYEVEITDTVVNAIKQNKPITIESITSFLREQLNSKITNIQDDISTLGERRSVLIESKKEKEKSLAINSRYKEIIDYQYLYSLAMQEYSFVEQQHNDEEQHKAVLEQKISKLIDENNSLHLQLTTLSKNKIINFFKIRRLNIELAKLQMKIQTLQQSLDEQSKVVGFIQTELMEMRTQFKNTVGIELNDYSQAFEKSKKLYSTVLDVSLSCDIAKIQRQIEVVEERLNVLLQEKKHLEEVTGVKKI